MYVFLKSEQCSDFLRPTHTPRNLNISGSEYTLKSEQPSVRKPPTHQNQNIVRILKICTYFWTLPKSIVISG